MSTVLPMRLWSLAVMASLGGVLGYFIAPLFVGEFDPNDGRGLIIGMVAGMFYGLLIVAIWSRQDARLAAVRGLHPWAVVEQVWTDKRFIAALREFNRTGDATKVGRQVTVAFDRPGAFFYAGTTEPVLLAHIPWAGMTGLSVTRLAKTANLGLALRLNLGETLAFALDRGPNLVTQGGFANEERLQRIAIDIESLRGLAPGARPVAPPSLAAGLLPGQTAYSAQRIAFIPLWAVTSVLFTALTVCITIFVNNGVQEGGFVTAVVGSVTLYAIVSLLWAATRVGRERGAGYTTLNGSQLELEQRHPRTGRAIRPAGARALTPAQFTDELRR